MTDRANWIPLNGESVQKAHALISPYIHKTPVITSKTLNRIASTPQTPEALIGTPFEGLQPAKPKINFFFKCENLQRIGAFKARGAFHALLRLIETKGIEEVRKRGVATQSSGNHAQAVALAASTLNVPAYIVMPSITIPSKVEGTKSYGAKVTFSGSTGQEREAAVAKIIAETGAILIPPYNHPDTILGQGTMAIEFEAQVAELLGSGKEEEKSERAGVLDAVITPAGGGGMLSGNATYFASRPQKTFVFGAEPSFQGGDDCRRGLAAGERITVVKTLTIADGLRTYIGDIPWGVISDTSKVRGVYSVSEDQIKSAMKLVFERMKVVVEPSAVVGLAVCLFDEDFRRIVEKEGGENGWDIGIVFSGGNTSMDAIAKLYADSS